MSRLITGAILVALAGAIGAYAGVTSANFQNQFNATSGQVVSCSVDSIQAVTYTVPAGKTFAGIFTIQGKITP